MAKKICRTLVSNTNVFSGCNDNFLDALSVLCRETTVPPENVIFMVNELTKELYIVAKGAVELVSEAGDAGDEEVTEVRRPGNVVGELGFFFGMR